MAKKNVYRVKSKVILWPGETAAWHFATIDKKTSEEVKKMWKGPRRGFGAVPVEVTLGKTVWKTSIFPDKRSGTYILPLKAAVRKAEGIYDGDEIVFQLKIRP